MAFGIINYASPELSKSPIGDLVSNILGGYEQGVKASYLAPTMEEQLQKAKLYNQYYGPNMESQIGLRGAQAGHLGSLTSAQNIRNKYLPQQMQDAALARVDAAKKRQFELENPLFGYAGSAGQLGALAYMKNHPELFGSQQGPSLQQDMQSYISSAPGVTHEPEQQTMHGGKDYASMMEQSILNSIYGKSKGGGALSPVGKLESEREDVLNGWVPGSNRTVPLADNDDRQRRLAVYDEKLDRIKAGQRYIYEEGSNQPIGVQIPPTEGDKKVIVGRTIFNDLLPVITEGMSGFSGIGSIKNYTKYAQKYGKDPEATKKIDNLALAFKAFPAAVANEQATLGTGRTNLTFRRLAETLPSSDVPDMLKKYISALGLPSSVDTKAAYRYQKLINSATKKAEESVPAYIKHYFPGKEPKKGQEVIGKISENIANQSGEPTPEEAIAELERRKSAGAK